MPYSIGKFRGAGWRSVECTVPGMGADVPAGLGVSWLGDFAVAGSDDGRRGDSIDDIEHRQDEVLRALAVLEQRLAELLAEYATPPVPASKAA
jgi:hypothetical protein